MQGSRAPARSAWLIVLVGFVAMVAGTPVGPAGFGVFVPPMSADLGWGRDLIGGAVAAGTIAGGLVAPWVGRIVDRHGARVMLTVAGLVLGAAYASVALVTPATAWLFYLSYGVARMVDMAVILLGATVAVSAAFRERRGRALGIVLSGNAVGVLLLVPLVQYVIVAAGWRSAWTLLGVGAAVVLAPMAWLLIRSGPPPSSAHSDDVPAVAVRDAVRTRAFWALLISATLAQAAYSAAGTHQIAFLSDNGLDPAAAIAAVATFAVVWGAGQVLWGLAAERVPPPWVLALGYLALAAALALITVTTTFGWAVVYAVLLGAALSNHEAVDAVAWADRFGTRTLGALRGIGRPLFLVGNASGAFVAGFAYEATGSYAPAFWVLGGLALLAAVVVTGARPPLAAATPSLR